MRYEKGHKEVTRQRIIETAAARFRKDGIEGVGVADLMAEAGLTHGGFYSHFSSKEELIKAAMEEASAVSAIKFDKRVEEGGKEESCEADDQEKGTLIFQGRPGEGRDP